MVDVDDFSPEFDRQSTSEVVREAVTRVHWSFLGDRSNRFRNLGVKISMEELFEGATSGMCLKTSLAVSHELAGSSSDMFTNMAIITTYDIPTESPIFHNVGSNSFHSYFLAEGKDGFWYAGSPGNHNLKIGNQDKAQKDPDYATTVFQDRSLKKLLKKIEGRDKCPFPSEIEIKKNLKRFEKSFSLEKGTLKIAYILRSEGKVYSEMKTDRFNKKRPLD